VNPRALTEAVRKAEAAVKEATDKRDALLLECVLAEGWTHDVAAEVFGVSRQRVGQLVKRYKQAHQARPSTPAERLREARDNYRLAVYAQQLRCEAETGMNRAEVRAFYGSPHESPADVVESPVRWAGFYESDTAARVRYEEAV
jgi:hypothetical protein